MRRPILRPSFFFFFFSVAVFVCLKVPVLESGRLSVPRRLLLGCVFCLQHRSNLMDRDRLEKAQSAHAGKVRLRLCLKKVLYCSCTSLCVEAKLLATETVLPCGQLQFCH